MKSNLAGTVFSGLRNEQLLTKSLPGRDEREKQYVIIILNLKYDSHEKNDPFVLYILHVYRFM